MAVPHAAFLFPLIAAFALSLDAAAQQLPFGDVPPGIVKQSFGCAAAVRDDSSRKRCALEDLRYMDGRLNARYRELRQMLQPGEVQGLLATQLAWINSRDTSCGLDGRVRQRQAWLEYVADSDGRATCVLRATMRRLDELERMQQQIRTAAVFAEVTPQPPEPAHVVGDVLPGEAAASEFLLRSARSHRSGKHYFELVIEEARADKVEANVVARVSDGRRWTGMAYDIRSRDLVLQMGAGSSVTIVGGNLGEIRVPRVVIGVAVDLDAGRFYWHRDGKWLNGAAPGSEEGVELVRDGSFTADVKSSVKLAELVDKGILKVNFGGTPFERRPPAGYRGFDWQEHLAETPTEKGILSNYPSKERIAGDSQVRWVQRYWEWVRSFSAVESPSADPNGHRCGAGQSGPVWFLTGSNQTGSVRRECEVPEGKILLVPIVNALAQANAEVACDKLLVSLRQFSAGVSDLYFSLDDTALKNPERTLLGTGCFQLRDASSGQVGLAGSTGYWVFLQPLKRGRHVIEFGAKFRAGGFQQDIGYVLHVR